MLEKLKSFKWGYIIIAFVLAAIGVCFISFTDALKALAITIGVMLCVFAVFFAILAIADKNRGVGFAFKIFFAVMSLIAGLVTAIFNTNTIEIIVAVFALVLIIDSSFKLHTSAMSKRYKVVGWWFITSIAAISISLCFVLLKFTPENQIACSVILGITMLLNSANNILTSIYSTIFERHMEEDIYKARHERERCEAEELKELQKFLKENKDSAEA